MNRPVRVMKFGGTSVGDASCIARSAQIIAQASREASVVVVVSAMSGVTNRLLAAATRAETGNREEGAKLAAELRNQHEVALSSLIQTQKRRSSVMPRLNEVLTEAQRRGDAGSGPRN